MAERKKKEKHLRGKGKKVYLCWRERTIIKNMKKVFAVLCMTQFVAQGVPAQNFMRMLNNGGSHGNLFCVL